MEASAEVCVREVLDVVPMVMRSLRAEFRSHRGGDLSIPQYRALMFLRRSSGASLSDLADHLGITLPSTSKLIEGLVERGLVDRRDSPSDRRRIVLALTTAGIALADASRREAEAAYIERFSTLPKETLTTVSQAMEALRAIFCEGSK